MGRSVSYPSNAIVAFADYSSTCEECDGDEDCPSCNGFYETDWDEETDYMQDRIAEVFPSFTACDKWLDREDHAIAENAFCYFGMSEYCGLVSFWLKAKDLETYYTDEQRKANLQDRWLNQVADKFIRSFGTLTKVGAMSNGEGVYRQIDTRS